MKVSAEKRRAEAVVDFFMMMESVESRE